VGHLRQHGFSVKTEDRDDLRPIKAAHRIPRELESCHTALVGGYVVEGHVPADVIKRLLRERPRVAGLAVPGMPAGSPGMESPGGRRERYEIRSFDSGGATRVYDRR
jgi:hypothetical protein